jgi:uncharacterized phage protein (TIGR01671 family)
MRTIKFRGKRKNNNKWVYGYYCHDRAKDTSHIIEDNSVLQYSFEVIPESVGQLVGLKDKNGKEIYEGDVLDYYNCDLCEGFKGNVFFDDGCFFVSSFDEIPVYLYEALDSTENPIVIGNVHENPELLEDKK